MIPNIVKGRGISGATRYALGQGKDAETGKPLELVPGENSRADILGGQNFGFAIDSLESVEMARRMMEWNGKPENQASRGRKCENDCLHASLSWEKGQEPSREDMAAAAQGFLKSIGMEGAQAVFIAHNDTEHKHLHIIASRLDPVTGKTFSQEDDFSKGQAWSLQYEREHGQIPQNEARRNLHKIVDAIEARDGAALVDNLTQRSPTFTARELDKVLKLGGLSKEDREEFRGQILGQKNVIGLRETADADVSRYTTRDVLAAEMALQRNAQELAADDRHGIKAARIDKAAATFTLKAEQADALRHLTGEQGFAVLWGQAGTGKSHTLKATRAAYEAEGKNVVGLSWTNDVVQQMRGDGFKRAETITSEMNALEKGRTTWDRKTVVILDEAAMVSTQQLARVAAVARDAGAKLILAGDDKQLSSIERGGMFETLRQSHGAAILKDVQRVADTEQKAAFGSMHKGEFLGALQTFEKARGLHWSARQADTLKDMAARYTADTEATPDKRRFMFAYTNADVAALNEHARGLHRSRGDLGQDHSLQTKTGAQTFATGDRIQFTGNARTKAEKNAGLVNGRVGTVAALEVNNGKARITIKLDTAKGAKPSQVSFVVGADSAAGEFDRFKHGYAGTIYRGQGRTLDEVYVGHSAQWRSSAAYVALTRHREAVHIFAARETAKDLQTMAEGMARPDNKRAATAYQIDERSAARAQLHEAVAAMASPAATEAARSASQAGAGHPAAPGTKAAPQPPERDLTEQVVDTVADLAEKAIVALADGLAGLLGGGPSKPNPKQQRAKKPSQGPTRKQSHQARVKAFLERERQQRAENLKKIARELNVSEGLTPEELEMEKAAQEKRSRDRGGGQSL